MAIAKMQKKKTEKNINKAKTSEKTAQNLPCPAYTL